MEDWQGDSVEEAYRFCREGYDQQLQGKLDEAIGLYRKSIELHPTAEAYTFWGWAASFRGRYDEAIELCRKAIELDPDFGNPYNDIGAYLIEQGKNDEALLWLERALNAVRYDAYQYPHYNLGRVWEKKGDWVRALAEYREALRLSPDYSLADRAVRRMEAALN